MYDLNEKELATVVGGYNTSSLTPFSTKTTVIQANNAIVGIVAVGPAVIAKSPVAAAITQTNVNVGPTY